MKVLVVTTEPITAAQFRDALRTDSDPAEAEVMVVAPALAESALRFWMSGLRREGEAQRYRGEVDPVELTERFGVPVNQAVP